jgi:hypothetical protein
MVCDLDEIIFKGGCAAMPWQVVNVSRLRALNSCRVAVVVVQPLTLATTTWLIGAHVFLWAFNQGGTQNNWTVKHFYNVFRHSNL